MKGQPLLAPNSPVHALLSATPVPKDSNLDLLFRRYLPVWTPGPNGRGVQLLTDRRAEGRTARESGSPQKDAIEAWIRAANGLLAQPPALAEHQERSARALAQLGGAAREVTLISRLAVGARKDSPIEAGVGLHPTLGVPFAPGAALKGLARAWSWLQVQDGQGSLERHQDWFGEDSQGGASRAGSIAFWPFLPAGGVALERDIINRHLPRYYLQSRSTSGGLDPIEDEDPIPVTTLVVKAGGAFIARVHHRGGDTAEAEAALNLLCDALSALGLGARTAIGYGRFAWKDQPDPWLRFVEERPTGLPGLCLTGYNPTEPPPDRWDGPPVSDWTTIHAPSHASDEAQWTEAQQQLITLRREMPGAHLVVNPRCTAPLALLAGAVFHRATGRRLTCAQLTGGGVTSAWDLSLEADAQSKLRAELLHSDEPGELQVALSVSNDVREAVDRWREETGQRGPLLHLQPEGGPSRQALLGAAQAVAFAEQARAHIQSHRRGRGWRLFLSAPNGLVLALGQQLNAMGPVRVMDFEKDKQTYVERCTLRPGA
jgi:CRISPR type III-B/RAMP module RAMP protein Cmr6